MRHGRTWWHAATQLKQLDMVEGEGAGVHDMMPGELQGVASEILLNAMEPASEMDKTAAHLTSIHLSNDPGRA